MDATTGELPTDLPPRATRRFGLARIHNVRAFNALLAGGVAAAGVAAYLVVGQSAASSQTTTRTADVTRGVVLSTVSATGTLQPSTELSIGFPTSGMISSVNVEAGQRVRRGQLLGRLDSLSARQSTQQAEASLASAQAQYEQTLTGETAAQRAQDAVGGTQARASVATAKTGLSAAKRAIALDRRTSAASVAQAQQQLRVDQGQLKVDVAKRGTDSATQASVDAAAAVVANDKAALQATQTTQQNDQQSQLDAQAQQTSHNAALSNDQNSLKTAQTNNDAAGIARYDAAVAADQSLLGNDQTVLAALQKTLSNDSFQIAQLQSRLSADQATQSTLTSDEQAIRGDESKIAADRSSIANAKNNQASSAMKDTQSLQSAQQQVAAAKLSLTSALAGIAVKQAPATPAAISAGRTSVLQAQIALANAKKALSETVLRAPVAGIVASVGDTPGEQVSGSGISAATSSSSSASSSSGASSSTGGSSGSSGSSSAFVTLTGLEGMQVSAGFAETDAAKIRPGQAATVTVDALPDVQFPAHVLTVAGTATSSSNVVTYAVTFALDRRNAQLKEGMTANVDVVTGEADNVLHVPTAAVRGSGANATVTVLRNGQQVSVPVVVGLQGDSATAIVGGGLRSSDQVVLPSVTIASSSSTGGATSTTGTTGAGTGGGRFRGGGFGGFGGIGG